MKFCLLLMAIFFSPGNFVLAAEEEQEIRYRIDTRIDAACNLHFHIQNLEQENFYELSLNPRELDAAILWTNTMGDALTTGDVFIETWEEVGSFARGAFEGGLYAGVLSRFALDRPRHLRRWFYFASVALGASYRYLERRLFHSGEDSSGEQIVNEVMRRFRRVAKSVPEFLVETRASIPRNLDDLRGEGSCEAKAWPAMLTGLDYFNMLRIAVNFGKERASDSRR